MSLRIFHICFIILSTLLCAGVSWLAFRNQMTPAFAWASAVFAVILPIYGIWFLKKTSKLIL